MPARSHAWRKYRRRFEASIGPGRRREHELREAGTFSVVSR